MVIVLTLLNKIGYGSRRISARGRILHLGGGGVVAIFKEIAAI